MFIFLSFIPLVSSSIVLNEIMYNPMICSDTYCEWIELYNPTNGSINLSGWSICGSTILPGFVNHSNGVIYLEENLLLDSFSFALVTDGGSGTDVYSMFNIPNNSLALHVDASALCGGLSDTADTIFLKTNESFLIDTFQYSDDFGGDGNNASLERRDDLSIGESIIKGGTPGFKNSIATFREEYSVLQITEFLSDPTGVDDAIKPQGEWVELYNSGSFPINLAGFFLTDQSISNELYISLSTVISQEDSTIGTIIDAKGYKTIYRSSDSDFSLNNNGYDEVHLYAPNNEEITSVTYSGSVEGMSWSEIGGTWYQTFPTPNSENTYKEGCDWTTDLDLINSIFEGDDFSFTISIERIAGNGATVTMKGEIQDINGNVLKQYSPWTNSKITTVNTKSYTPNLADGTYQIHFWIEDISCNDYDLTNNDVNKLVAINENYLDNESNLDIEKIYLGKDKTARWGDLLRIKTNIYKGKTSKYAVELWAEKDGTAISKRTKVNVHDPFTYYSLTLPLFLEANCNNKFSDGKVRLILKGIEQEVQEEFTIKGSDSSLCDQSSVQFQEKESSKGTNSQEIFELLNLPVYIVPGQTVPITAQIMSDDLPHSYLVWMYLYKGRTCYSCSFETVERKEMQRQVSLQPNDITQIPFELTVDSNIEPGEYKLKLKIIKDNLVTPKENTYDVLVAQMQEDTLSLFSSPDNNLSKNIFSIQNELTSVAALHNRKGIVVYESSSTKAAKLVPYFLILSVGILTFLFFKKEI